MSDDKHSAQFSPFFLRFAENLRSIFDSLYDGIITVDPAGKIQQFNKAAEKITAFSADEALDKPLHVILRSRKEALTEMVVQSISANRRIENYGLEITTKDGRLKTINITSTVLSDIYEDKPAGAVISIADVTEIYSLKEELRGRYRLDQIIGKNHLIQQVYDRILQTAESDSTVLIQGESGTGKELVAHAIHYHSHRAHAPFIKVNCSALAETLLESELFGHVKGAFTGALYDKVGRFEAANGGTIFLDEVGDFSPFIQLKLLRVLQEREFERVGETASRKSDVRIIAATSRNLKDLVQKAEFRPDLYYRLRVIPIFLPPLRERRDDLPLLINHFINRFNKIMAKRIRGVSEESMVFLWNYDWPGNIRELEHALEHAIVLSRSTLIEPHDLPLEIRKMEDFEPTQERKIRLLKHSRLETKAEHSIITQALREAAGNRTQAANILGISRTTLWRKMRTHHIE
ncbi:MAG: PAS domain S-box protein [Candidatus Abyssobacteria bacterium SURF_5]|uniref:PAS domain S-box protein n=1 Tax=Abyssobacteria bacterium (strain SURF_5) TaxID=2093360 RepID=A0A3A4NM59_ABYX5|nr:MAG: PAS domain S-box protein [Candidatus Abyssubacteria bacterium SURF_5]